MKRLLHCRLHLHFPGRPLRLLRGPHLDIDRFIARNQPSWVRLGQLSRRPAGKLSPDELDELVRLYQRVSTHLSLARSHYRDPNLTAALTTLVADASSRVYGSRTRTLRAIGRFFADTFPAALWRARWFAVASTALFLLPALATGTWIAQSPLARQALGPEEALQAYVEEDFEAYYSELPSTLFATAVTTNNIQVSFLAFAGGIGLCLPTAYVLVLNGAHVGFAGGLFAAVGQQPVFWTLILPHGLLEITAVLIAGAAGLQLGWALIDPGDRRRADALAEEGRRAVVIVIGLVLVFITAGLIEGYVTGSRLPAPARVGIGTAIWLGFLAYATVRGRAAAARGLTGALGEHEASSWARPATAAPSP